MMLRLEWFNFFCVSWLCKNLGNTTTKHMQEKCEYKVSKKCRNSGLYG